MGEFAEEYSVNEIVQQAVDQFLSRINAPLPEYIKILLPSIEELKSKLNKEIKNK